MRKLRHREVNLLVHCNMSGKRKNQWEEGKRKEEKRADNIVIRGRHRKGPPSQQTYTICLPYLHFV
jgi:hypothetical protein